MKIGYYPIIALMVKNKFLIFFMYNKIKIENKRNKIVNGTLFTSNINKI